jgi:hypothetical protein
MEAAIIGLIVLTWLSREVWAIVHRKRKADRDQRIAQVNAKRPQPMSRNRHRAEAVKHDAIWNAREVLTGFPVTRTAFHSAWLAHKVEARQHAHRREEQRALIGELTSSLHQRVRERKAPAAADEVSSAPTGRQVPEPMATVTPLRAPPAPAGGQPDPPAPAPAPAPAPGPYVRPVPSTQGEPVMSAPAAADVTYTGIQRYLSSLSSQLEYAISEIRFAQMENTAEMAAALVNDPQTLSDLADTADQLRQMKSMMHQMLDRTQASQRTLARNHGGIDEAVADSPVAMAANPGFYGDH